MDNRIYMCIDLKSFYASVECVERNLDPLDTNLVVADISRTEKTICLAVTPSLKAYKISGRARLFEVISQVDKINAKRLKEADNHKFIGSSYSDKKLKENKNLKLDFIKATPRMNLYMKYSSIIYNTYLEFIAPEDILVYSIDEVFCDITDYIKLYKLTPQELTTKIINRVLEKTKITATAGIGTNMYLAKIAMDIVAKHKKPDKNGVRIAQLDELTYRKELWNHKPITDFWRVGNGIANKLKVYGIETMGDIARCSLNKDKYYNENLLFKLFGVNAELLIDHSWGYEPCTIKDAKNYKSKTNSISIGQVLHRPYNVNEAKVIVTEMAELLSLDLVSKHIVTNQIYLVIGYDKDSNLTNYTGEVILDYLGRSIPKQSHGLKNFNHRTSSTEIFMKEFVNIYNKIVNPNLLIRRINLVANNVESDANQNVNKIIKQFDLFIDNDEEIVKQKIKKEKDERKVQEAILKIKLKYGKNAIIKGINLDKAATTRERNESVGGHKA